MFWTIKTMQQEDNSFHRGCLCLAQLIKKVYISIISQYLIHQNRSIKHCQRKINFFLNKLFENFVQFLLNYRVLSFFSTPGIKVDKSACLTLACQSFQSSSAFWKRQVWLFHAGRWTAVHLCQNIKIPAAKYPNVWTLVMLQHVQFLSGRCFSPCSLSWLSHHCCHPPSAEVGCCCWHSLSLLPFYLSEHSGPTTAVVPV